VRLFASVRPSEAALDHLDLALASVRAALPSSDRTLRWSDPSTWHLTVAFFGEVPDGLVDELDAGLAARVPHATGPFGLHLRGAGVFAHRTLWVGVGGETDAMHALVTAAQEAGADVGARADERVRSRPHLTVARARGSSAADGVVHALGVYSGPRWTVGAVELVESLPGEGRGGGPLYRTVREYPLGGEECPGRAPGPVAS